jgi:hypothetical protein
MQNVFHLCLMKGKTAYIYVMFNGNDPVYVGKTTRLKEREKEHKTAFRKNKMNVEMVVLEEIKWGVGSEYWEKFYYCLFTSFGFKLHQKMRLRKPGTGASTYRILCTCKFRYEVKDVLIDLSKLGYGHTDSWNALNEEDKTKILFRAVYEKESKRPLRIIKYKLRDQTMITPAPGTTNR